MVFLRSVTPVDASPVIHGKGLYLRAPQAGDYGPWAELRARSRDFLEPWEPRWTEDELSRNAYRRRLKHYQRDLREATGYTFFLFRQQDRVLLGGISLTNLRRGITQSVMLGYWMGRPYAGRGWMTEGVRTVIPFVFDTLRLHRLEAACIPSNTASVRVLQKCGFAQEGLARSYLKINGIWQDHHLFAKLADDLR